MTSDVELIVPNGSFICFHPLLFVRPVFDFLAVNSRADVCLLGVIAYRGLALVHKYLIDHSLP